MFRRLSTTATAAAAAAVSKMTSTSATTAVDVSSFRFASSSSSNEQNNSNSVKNNNKKADFDPNVVPPSHRAAPGPYEKVGNILLVQCSDLPSKHSAHINAILRSLRFEFKGQWTAHPDIPEVREDLFRVRHCVIIEPVSLDEMKLMLEVPEHVTFSDLKKELPQIEGRGSKAKPYPHLRHHEKFMEQRKSKLRDVAERDSVELRLLDARKQAMGVEE